MHVVMEVQLNCRDLAGRALRDIDLPQRVMVILVRRDGAVIYRRGEATFQVGDLLTLMGPLEDVHEQARRCGWK